jgi:hypothetical protein
VVNNLLLLRQAERKLGSPLRCRIAAMRAASSTRRSKGWMARASAIACGHKDAIDLDRLRHDPLMKVAVALSGQRRTLGLAVDYQSSGECAAQTEAAQLHRSTG